MRLGIHLAVVIAAFCLMFAPLVGCGSADEQDVDAREVTLYTSVDEPYARQIVDAFESAHPGITVRLVTDTEATKSVALAERVRAEASRPVADVWWGNEPFLTVQLAGEGIFAPYPSPSAMGLPEAFVGEGHLWHGSAARARVIVMATGEDVPDVDEQSVGLQTLLDPRFKGRVAIADPTAGTTRGHVSAIYSQLGEAEAQSYFRELAANEVKLLGGNSDVARQAGRGAIWIGLTDNDDVDAAREAGMELRMLLPDQQGAGTLMVPTTVALVKNDDRDESTTEAACELIDFLLAESTEQLLIEIGFAQYGLRDGPGGAVALDIDYAEVAREMPARAMEARALMRDGEASAP